MSWVIAKALDPGLKRKKRKNQDAVGVIEPNLFNHKPPVLLLADGMGGYKGGEKASKLVIEQMKKTYLGMEGTDFLDQLKCMVQDAHNSVKEYSERSEELEGMGSTVAAAILTPLFLYIANIGDSRVYLIRKNMISCLSYDHSFVHELLSENIITEEEAKNHPNRSLLTMSLSGKIDQIEHFSTKVMINRNDQILLCSDGLWGAVEEEEILDTCLNNEPHLAVQELVDKANHNGGPDNISILLAHRIDKVGS